MTALETPERRLAPVPDFAGARRRVAVIGAGVSGLTTAYLLREQHDVVLFEAEPRAGGHAHTHAVDENTERATPPSNLAASPKTAGAQVDSGFIVHNRRTCPHLLRLFDELDVTTQECEMSMSIHCEGCGLEYAGGRGAGGLLAQPKRLLHKNFRRMLLGVRRFHRRALAFLESDDDATTFGAWLDREGFDDYLVGHYAIPLVACVWSSGQGVALDYPARYLFRFLDHHGMLSVTGSPQWYTVTGGSARYVERIVAALPDVRLGTPVRAVSRTSERSDVTGVPEATVTTDDGTERFDHVVLATHADVALELLADASQPERDALGAFTYTANRTLLHHDSSVLPDAEWARASWNYRMTSCSPHDDAPTVTYWMNRLQSLPPEPAYLVTLNDIDGIDDADRVALMHYTHPVYTPTSVAAQDDVRALMSDTTSFAGAHLGWGFHEDGCRSGVEVARRLGSTW